MNIADKNVGILYGGWSDERLISLESGKSVFDSLTENNFNVFMLDYHIDNPILLEEFIIKNNIEIVFNLIHGVGGEDGYVQKYLEDLPVITVGSDSESSHKSFNKILTKESWIANNLKTPNYLPVNPDVFEINIKEKLGTKFVLKPVESGSSVGIKILDTQDFILNDKDMSYSKLCSLMNSNITPSNYFLEEYIDTAEFTAPIISNKVYPIIKIDTKREFYNYEAKYIDNDTSFTFPEFSKNIQDKIDTIALDAFIALGCSTWGRVDFFMDNNHNINLIEINSIPGMTSHSLVPMSAKKSGLSYIDLISLILKS